MKPCRLAQSVFTTFIGLSAVVGANAHADSIDDLRNAQVDKLKTYVLDAILDNGLVRDALVLDPSGTHFHPPTPDAAGVDLVGLCALHHLGKLPDAEQWVEKILNAYSGHTAGVVPARSANGHFIHFMNPSNGSAAGGGWDDSYSPISTALLTRGAQFASNHFPGNTTIASRAHELTNSVDFNAAIHPTLNGGIYHDVGANGTGNDARGVAMPWNEYMLVESTALRQSNNQRATAVRSLWLETSNVLKKTYTGFETLTDQTTTFAPAFWVHQGHFLNPDFRHSAEFEQYFRNQQRADQIYSTGDGAGELGEDYRYGLTAGVSPQGYAVDRIGSHPNKVFSPEAVGAWGDLATLLRFDGDEPNVGADRYGLFRRSTDQPNWIPPDAALVDHLFLLYGLVESTDPNFFPDRLRFVPEPASWAILAIGLAVLAVFHQKRSRHTGADRNWPPAG